PGHLQMDAAGMGALSRMDREERLHLRQDTVERAGLVAAVRSDGIAMHGIARPDHHAAFALHRTDQARQMIADLLGAEPVDQRQPSRLVVRIEHVDQTQQIVELERGSAFQADWIFDATEIFDMAMIGLAGAVADPDHVARGSIPVTFSGITVVSGKLVTNMQRLMSSIC